MKGRKRRSVLQSARADGDEMRRPPGHLIKRAGREEVMRKGGGEELRSVRCMCAAHGDRAAVGVGPTTSRYPGMSNPNLFLIF